MRRRFPILGTGLNKVFLAMNRIDRLTAILIQLQSRRVVKAQDMADRFGISLRTVYRDIRSLEEAGVPILGEAGVGYSLMEGYRLPPVMFSMEEATAFLTAEKLVEKLTDASTRSSYQSAMYKVKAVLRSQEKDHIEVMEQHIEVVENAYLPDRAGNMMVLQDILKAIGQKRVLAMDYFSEYNQQQTTREAEPVGIFYRDRYWYLIAYCRLRQDYRHFKAESISRLKITETVFEKTHPVLGSFLTRMSKEKDLQKVVIRIAKGILKYLGDEKYYHGFVSQKETGNGIELTFLSSSLQGLARWFLMFGDQADVLQPASLRELIKQQLEEIKLRMTNYELR